MYVCGRGTDGYGTIIPAILEAVKKNHVNKIDIITRSSASANITRRKIQLLCDKMAVFPEINVFPNDDTLSFTLDDYINSNSYDAAIVAIPDHLHCNVCIQLMQQGLHCLVVKPMAPTFEEAMKMANVAKEKEVVAQVEFHKRYDQSNLLLKDAIQSGELGHLLYAVVEYSQPKYIPEKMFSQWADKTSIFQYLGVHYVDLLQFATYYKPLTVTAWGQKSYLASKGIDTWDSMQVVIRWTGNERQFVSTHITNWVDPNCTSATSDQKINVVGTKGRYQADQKHRGIQTVVDDQGVNDINPYFTSCCLNNSGKLSYTGYGIDSVLGFLTDVLDYNRGDLSLKEINETRPSFENCLDSSYVIELAHKSIKQNNETVYV